MCLIVFHWRPDEGRLTLVANRDEFHRRPAAPLQVWSEQPEIVAGRDLQAGGTWLGLSRRRRLAAITNVRAAGEKESNGPSRGELVRDFLLSSQSPEEFARALHGQGRDYAGFNLLLMAENELWHVSNRDGRGPSRLVTGFHGLSNASLDTPWPKLLHARTALEQHADDPDLHRLLDVTARREVFADEELPNTGLPSELERLLSPPFIVAPVYGTRCTTAIRLDQAEARILEKSFDANGEAIAEEQMALDFVA